MQILTYFSNLRKVDILLRALEKGQKDIEYFALDISRPELERTLSAIQGTYKHVRCQGLFGTYDDGLSWLKTQESLEKPKCILSMGSSIGNFDRTEAGEFLKAFSHVLRDQDFFLIGIDACQDADRIYHAYNDREGKTHEFILNGLTHANKLMGKEIFKGGEWKVVGEFDKDAGRHQAFYSPIVDVVVEDNGCGVAIKAGEKIRAEESYKYSLLQSNELWQRAGMRERARFSNTSNDYRKSIHLFALMISFFPFVANAPFIYCYISFREVIPPFLLSSFPPFLLSYFLPVDYQLLAFANSFPTTILGHSRLRVFHVSYLHHPSMLYYSAPNITFGETPLRGKPITCISLTTMATDLYLLSKKTLSYPLKPDEYAARPIPSLPEFEQLWNSWDIVTRHMIPETELLSKPIILRNCCLFYLGHIPAFFDKHLTGATGEAATTPNHYHDMFERGIDPDVDNPENCHAHSAILDEWPPLAEILDYQARVRSRARLLLQQETAATNGKIGRAMWIGFEHEGKNPQPPVHSSNT